MSRGSVNPKETAARKFLNAANCIPVRLVEGGKPPTYEGRSFEWRTRGGTLIDHPSAYSKYGWSNMVYCRSTLHIEVGKDWDAA